MHTPNPGFGLRSWADLVRERARREPHAVAFVFLEDGENPGPSLTYAELLARVEAAAGALRQRTQPGDRVVLVFAPGLDFIVAFHACIFAGVVAVPTFPPEPRRLQQSLGRLRGIVGDCSPRLLLGHRVFADQVSCMGAWCDWETLGTAPLLASEPNTLAFLQYTSGSTAAPRGVMVTHANLLHNSAYIYNVQSNHLPSVGLTWLPNYHDMGLIEGLLQPLFGGFTGYFMSPLSFLEQPRRWLQAISRFHVTSSGGPNFGYELCCRRVSAQLPLDLSSWRVAYNGAEPIRVDTMHRFVAQFEPSGFKKRALFPVYGMAEATLMISSGGIDDEPVEVTVGEHVRMGVGRVGAGMDVRIVDGEIWLRGESVAAGYYNQPDATRETFAAYLPTGEGPYLRTGDLGFLREGELFVVGRRKDLIIVRGTNHHPADIELTVERAHPAVRAGCAAAVAIEKQGEEALGLAIELKEPDASVEPAVRSAVAAAHGLEVASIVFLAPGALPKTSSGKLQRFAARALFVAQVPKPVAHTGWKRAARAFLVERLGELLGRAPVMTEAPTALGLDSLSVISLKGELQDAFEVRFDIDKLFDAPTLAEGIDAMLLAAQKDGAAPRMGSRASEDETGLWVWQASRPQSRAFDIDVHINGVSLDRQRLSAALLALQSRHETLRSVFTRAGDHVVRGPSSLFPLHDGPMDDAPFSLADEPPWRAAISATALHLRFHHIGFDLAAITTLLGELNAQYMGVALPAAEQPSHRSPPPAVDDAYWRDAFSRPCKPLRLPLTDAVAARGEVPFSGQFAHALAKVVSALGRYGNNDGFWIGISTLGRAPAFARCIASFSTIAPLYVPPGVADLTPEALAQQLTASLHQLVARHDVSRHRWAPHARVPIDLYVHYRQLPSDLPPDWNDALLGSGELTLFGQRCSVVTTRGHDPRARVELDVTIERGVLRVAGDSAPLVREILRDPDVLQHTHVSASRVPDEPAPVGQERALHTVLAALPQTSVLFAPRLQMPGHVLAAHSSKWAAYLRQQGLQRGDVCCLYVEPSLQVIPALLGALLCGAQVMCLNVEWPAARTLALLQALKPKIVLRQTQQSMRFPPQWPALSIQDEIPRVALVSGDMGEDSESAALLTLRGMDVKRVAVPELVSRARAWHEALALNDDMLTVAEPPWHFDWLFVLLASIHCGHRAYIAPIADLGCPGWLVEHMRDIGITRYVANAFRMRHLLNDIVGANTKLPLIKTWIVRHGPRTPELQAKLAQYFPVDNVRVSYGWPLPATIGHLSNDLRAAGSPLPGVTIAVSAPVGGVGEISVNGVRSGDRGYVDLSQALFLADADAKFVEVKGERVSVPFVEQQLAAIAGVQAARVLAFQDAVGHWNLAAYVQTQMSPEEVRVALRDSLVRGEEPTSIDIVDDVTGALPDPVWLPRSERRGPPPQTAAELRVAQWFSIVLGVTPQSIDDDFFHLGGDSMLLLKLLSLMQDAGTPVSLAELREHSTVRRLAAIQERFDAAR